MKKKSAVLISHEGQALARAADKLLRGGSRKNREAIFYKRLLPTAKRNLTPSGNSSLTPSGNSSLTPSGNSNLTPIFIN